MGHSSTQMGKSYHEITRDYISKLKMFQLQAFYYKLFTNYKPAPCNKACPSQGRYYIYTNSGASVWPQ